MRDPAGLEIRVVGSTLIIRHDGKDHYPISVGDEFRLTIDLCAGDDSKLEFGGFEWNCRIKQRIRFTGIDRPAPKRKWWWPF